MAQIQILLTSDEVNASIPYAMVCMTRYGYHWNTLRRKRRWEKEFTEAERKAATRLFAKARNWTIGSSVPETVRMSVSIYSLWLKLGAFCASI